MTTVVPVVHALSQNTATPSRQGTNAIGDCAGIVRGVVSLAVAVHDEELAVVDGHGERDGAVRAEVVLVHSDSRRVSQSRDSTAVGGRASRRRMVSDVGWT
jgi:hypothetical protein